MTADYFWVVIGAWMEEINNIENTYHDKTGWFLCTQNM